MTELDSCLCFLRAFGCQLSTYTQWLPSASFKICVYIINRRAQAHELFVCICSNSWSLPPACFLLFPKDSAVWLPPEFSWLSWNDWAFPSSICKEETGARSSPLTWHRWSLSERKTSPIITTSQIVSKSRRCVKYSLHCVQITKNPRLRKFLQNAADQLAMRTDLLLQLWFFSSSCVKGLHLNMCVSLKGFKVLLSLIIGPYLPFLVGFSREDVRRLFPYFEKNVWEMLRESGYLHIQATKPDTAGESANTCWLMTVVWTGQRRLVSFCLKGIVWSVLKWCSVS